MFKPHFLIIFLTLVLIYLYDSVITVDAVKSQVKKLKVKTQHVRPFLQAQPFNTNTRVPTTRKEVKHKATAAWFKVKTAQHNCERAHSMITQVRESYQHEREILNIAEAAVQTCMKACQVANEAYADVFGSLQSGNIQNKEYQTHNSEKENKDYDEAAKKAEAAMRAAEAAVVAAEEALEAAEELVGRAPREKVPLTFKESKEDSPQSLPQSSPLTSSSSSDNNNNNNNKENISKVPTENELGTKEKSIEVQNGDTMKTNSKETSVTDDVSLGNDGITSMGTDSSSFTEEEEIAEAETPILNESSQLNDSHKNDNNETELLTDSLNEIENQEILTNFSNKNPISTVTNKSKNKFQVQQKSNEKGRLKWSRKLLLLILIPVLVIIIVVFTIAIKRCR